MPAHERAKSPNATAQRSGKPTLSTGVMRSTNRPPLTPKVATRAPQTTTVPALVQTAKRTPMPILKTSGANGPKRLGAQEDDLSLFASTHITPRSGKRQSRVDSANHTPNGTPKPDCHAPGRDRDKDKDRRPGIGRSPPPLGADFVGRSGVTFSNVRSDLDGHSRHEAQSTADSKFFYASDVKAVQQAPPPTPGLGKGPSFLNANGRAVERTTSSASSSPPLGHQTHPQENSSSKFIYANGIPDLRPAPPPSAHRPGSVTSAVSRGPASRPGTHTHPSAQSATSPGSISPQRLQAAPPTKVVKPSNTVANRVQVVSTSQSTSVIFRRSTSDQTAPALQRNSPGAERTASHSRQSSLATSEVRLKSPQTSSPSSPISACLALPAPLTLATIAQAAADADGESVDSFGSDGDEQLVGDDEVDARAASPGEARSGFQSPTKSIHSTDPLSELVANARRERKVQDLQITNASLEAINRTLERQLRKQTAELRRYKRLSRSGRLSTPCTTDSNGPGTDSSATEGLEGHVLSDLSDAASDDASDAAEQESEGDESDIDESLSPRLVAQHDAKHRVRDEKRLTLDLSKHHELLIDSQKINQSIKRCLDWTEELIKNGKKALEYRVRVSDVELAPRVLRADDADEEVAPKVRNGEDDAAAENQDEDVPIGRKGQSEHRLAPRIVGRGMGTQDRDSGIELPVDGV